ncbi:response regulator transcription factor [Streptomyces dysideae]|uniref:Two-component system response regulator n=1 Tax=Streptomyces dysideae TaxID=909626 RepID=A0A101USU5_9ACTN|nr:response regulator transcription factor [Streptomyces dysideae]KUO16233.1 two-component system response regulator [Streptomyces dysideae]
MGRATVLVVDDERKIRDMVRAFLERQRYAVLQAGTGQEALDVALRLKPDLVVLDLMLPDLAGEEVARSLREISQVPIIMLTAKAGEADRVAGLQLGADDYVVKPFSPRELVARVDAVLRRARPGGTEGRLSFDGGRLVIDPSGREVRLDGAQVALTRSEFDLLAALATTAGRVFSRRELVARVHGYDYEGYERTADVHVKNLRAKLHDDPRAPRWVVTVPGVGYKVGARPDA